ncbi:vomeronasal type-1 receptor 4-like [Phacochoerus africanus]|uniref:vomeronasal type-1 receptor 4-like n=1 Tax=Phacochoerus africanus TaxID=41426 RepID=UPI001FDA7D44|nr:vomeronasal type-1 receptor 4-like [Phacochoerus africanus]
MASVDVTTDVIILTQTVVGLLGNFSLFCHYIILYFTGCRSRSTDVILQHLIVANFLTLLSKGVPQTMAAFGWEYSPSDFGCKMIFFLHRMGRGVSMGSICLLSVFQVITISPQNSRWAELKAKAPQHIVPSMCLCWMLQMLVNVVFPVNITGKYSDKNITNRRDFGYCSALRYDETRSILLALLLLLPDVSCLGLMLWASGSMVFLLYRHKQQVQHIRRNIISPRSSPESRATRTILLLVSSFVSFYTLACTFQLVLALFGNPSWFLVKITIVMAAWFPTVSPFLLMSRDLTVHRIYVAWIRNAQSPTVRRNL